MDDFIRTMFFLSCGSLVVLCGYRFIRYLLSKTPVPAKDAPGLQIPGHDKDVWDIQDCEAGLLWLRTIWSKAHVKPELFINAVMSLRDMLIGLPESAKKTELLAQVKNLIDEITAFLP